MEISIRIKGKKYYSSSHHKTKGKAREIAEKECKGYCHYRIRKKGQWWVVYCDVV